MMNPPSFLKTRMAGQVLGLTFALANFASADPGIDATLDFAGGNTLSGQLLKFNEDNTLSFSSSTLQGENILKSDNLLSANLATIPPAEKGKHFVVATVQHYYKDEHQDTIRGSLVSIEDDKIVLDTAYAGRLSLNRRMVMGLDFFTSSPVIYQGPDDLENWSFSSGKADNSWEQQGSALIARGNTAIAREIKTPERSHISFTIDWRGRGTFRFLFFSSDGSSISPNEFYDLSVNNSSYIRLTQFSQENGRNESIFQRSYSQLRNQDHAIYDLYLDRSGEKASALLIDGKILHTWTENKGVKNLGDWFHFAPEEATPMRLTDFTVTQWDGKLPKSEVVEDDEGNIMPSQEEETEPDEFENLEGQHIQLKNGDTIIGKIRSVEDGRLMAETSFGDIAIPVDRAAKVSLDLEDKHEPKMWKNEIRAWFHNGGYITLRLISQNGDKIRASSQVFGEAEFDLKAFSHIDFNIWRRDLEADRNGNNEW